MGKWKVNLSVKLSYNRERRGEEERGGGPLSSHPCLKEPDTGALKGAVVNWEPAKHTIFLGRI